MREEWVPQIGDVIRWSAKASNGWPKCCHPSDRMVVVDVIDDVDVTFNYIQKYNSLSDHEIYAKHSLGCVYSPHSRSWFVLDPFLTAARKAIKSNE